MDETWLYHYDPETKQQSMEWRHSGSPHPKKFRVQISAGKNLSSIFWDQEGFFLVDYPNYQRGVLPIPGGAIEGHFHGKMPRKAHQGGLILARQCSGSPGTCNPEETKKLAYLGFQCLDHPPYSPDLAPSDYHLFLGLKRQLKGHHFSSDAEVIAAMDTWLDGQPSEFFFWVAFKSYRNVLRSVLSFVGSMLNKYQVWLL